MLLHINFILLYPFSFKGNGLFSKHLIINKLQSTTRAN